MPTRILFIGGTGIISAACTRLAVARGHTVTLLNRGKHAIPAGVHVIEADVNDEAAAARALADRTFDVVVQFVAYMPEQIERDLRLFRNNCGQYMFISSASAYQKPPTHPVITESTPLANPFWQYSRNKILCEEVLTRAHRDDAFPGVIIRPSYTYDEATIPLALNSSKHPWTVPQRMLDGKPVIVPGDGTSLWTNTHNTDFAKGLIGLLGNPQANGHAFHITSDESGTWNQFTQSVAWALGVDARIVHIPSDLLAAHHPDHLGGLIGDKSNSVIFDNSKLRRLVPDFAATVSFAEGMRRSIAWYRADPSRQTSDETFNAWCDQVLDRYRQAWPDGAMTF